MHYRFHIAGMPVFGRVLPSGDLAVWHPYNPDVRRIVEPICRHRGYWRSSHNNWLVLCQFREQVMADLKEKGDQHA